MRALIVALVLIATPAWAQGSCPAQLDAMVNLTTQMFQMGEQQAKAQAEIKKLQAEIQRLKNPAPSSPPAPSMPKAPGADELGRPR
jgi:hypothetical protein